MKRQELHRPRGARACPGANRRVIEYHQPRSQTRKSTTPAPWIRNNSNTYPRQFRRQFRDWCASASSGLPRSRCRRVGKASFCYPSLPRFLAEVARILRPGGHFLYADLRRRDGVAKWEEELGDAPCGSCRKGSSLSRLRAGWRRICRRRGSCLAILRRSSSVG